MELALDIKNLQKVYDQGQKNSVMAVNDVSFDIQPGEIFGLLGPNGAGKTSIISIITTLEKPSAGTAKVFGYDVTQCQDQTKRLTGVVHQEIINTGFFDVKEVLEFMSGYYGIWKNNERINYILNKLGLYEHRNKKVKQLSGGMKRRLMVAKALVHSPKLLLLDEPTAGVDVSLREDLWIFVRELQKEGMSILLTTHYLQEAQELCGRVGIIDKGQIKLVEKTESVIKKFSVRRVMLKTKKVNNSYQQSLHFEKEENGFQIFCLPAELSVGDLLRDLKVQTEDIQDIQTQEGSLESAFKNALNREPKEVRL